MNIQPLNRDLQQDLQNKINNKTKPLHALGKLEKLALQIGLIQNSLSPALNKPQLLLFAGDHGVVSSGVSPYPQEVTQQMVANFVQGSAAINVFCRQNNIAIDVIDAGVNGDLSSLDIHHEKVAMGTANFLERPAMTEQQFQQAKETGARLVKEKYESGCNVIGFGEMGIGNTSSAAILLSVLSQTPIEECVGRGTGLDDAGVEKKAALLKSAIEYHHKNLENTAPDNIDPEAVLQIFGGFELVMIYGGVLQAAALKMVVLVDGFIVSAAVMAAIQQFPEVKGYCVFSHLSDENAHKKMLDFLQVEPLLQLNMRLGEGSAVAVTYPLIVSAVNFLNEMSSFDSAGVSAQELYE